MTSYIIIDRQYNVPLALKYDSHEQADNAVTNSAFIDGLCEKDCLDLWVSSTYPADANVVTPPDETVQPSPDIRSLPQKTQNKIKRLLTQHLTDEGLIGAALSREIERGMDSNVSDLETIIPVRAVIPPPARAQSHATNMSGENGTRRIL